MLKKNTKCRNRHYVVVLQASSGARFIQEAPRLVCRIPTPRGLVVLTFRTRYLNEGFSVPIPRGIWVDARGPAKSLQEAIETFSNIARTLTATISFSTNAPIEALDVALAFEDTPNCNKLEFIQYFLPDDTGIPRQGRPTNVEATVALLKTFDSNPDRDRLLRAIAQYELALLNWRPGREILALAHLYMGMETLTKAALRKLCKDKKMTERELANYWGIELKQLDSEVRRRVLFKGNNVCYANARNASDAFEHGYKPMSEIRALAANVRVKTASYLRLAILKHSEIDKETFKILSKDPYDKPLDYWNISKRISGYLLRKESTARLAEKGQEYPRVRWQTSVKSVSKNELGEYEINIEEKFTASFAKGISFQHQAYEVGGPKKMRIKTDLQ